MSTELQEELTREEAKRILRRLELDAYSAVVTAFRAQGDVNRSKKCVLTDLANHLSISTERHRAEVRRVVNDERLNAVAECMQGSGTSTEWMYEGRRLISLMPRLVPQTIFTAKATVAANQATEENLKLPLKTEIELHPLVSKPKGLTPKGTQATDQKVSPATADDLEKKRKNLLNVKTPPLMLNKSITSSLKPSNQSTSVSMKSIIKNKSVMPSPFILSNTITSTSISPVKQSPTQHKESPIKIQTSATLSPVSTVVSFSTSTNLETSINLQPCNLTSVKMVTTTETINNNHITSLSSSSYLTNCFPQKIKFKTPLSKFKLKPAKYKPMTTMQRVAPSISQLNETNALGSLSQLSTSLSPSMSVKVVQLAKTNSSPILSSVNRSAMSENKNPIQSAVTFNSIATSLSQQMKAVSASQLPSSVMSALPKGALPSKSMPLTTGFKMIAVTTVVQGTTQVKTVYIATPIMSLSKSLTPTTAASITTNISTQCLKRIPSSAASNIQSVVACSTNPSTITYHGKSTQISSITPNNITSPTSFLGKTLQVSPKGLGSLKTTLVGHAQSLKLFTAVSKSNRAQFSNVNLTKSTTLLPGTNLGNNLVSSVSLQHNQLRNIQLKSPEVKKFLSPTNHLDIATIDSMKVLHKLYSSDNSVNKLCSPDIETEQITASASADTDDMAFLNAGEKFLEQLSAKMTNTSPGISKNGFLFTSSNDQFDSNSKDGLTNENKNVSVVISKITNIIENSMTSISNTLVNNTSQFSNMFSGSYCDSVNSQKAINAESSVGFKSHINKSMDLCISEVPVTCLDKIDFHNSYSNGISVTDFNQRANSSLHMSVLESPIKQSTVFTNSLHNNLISINSLNFPKTSSKEIHSTQTVPLSNSFDIGSTFKKLACSEKDSIVLPHLSQLLPNLPIMATSKVLSYNNKEPEIKKRKMPSQESSDLSSLVPARTQASWIRGAANIFIISLLQRVSRFRGPAKQKGEMNAASWFTKPVDPNEAPGYYRVIKTPMDFGKIKRKLEDGEYSNYTMFYEDMMLIKSNCYAYNPADHAARKDCDDVFFFFEAEFKKLLERWEKYHVSPYKKMKISTEVGDNG
ncbi:BRCA2-interacting transcriptional repressor EMSY isoform X3 [Hydra vulgaris]